MSAYDVFLTACGGACAVWGAILVLNLGGVAERMGQRSHERLQRGYRGGTEMVPFASMLAPSTTAGVRRLGVALVLLGVFGILGILSGA